MAYSAVRNAPVTQGTLRTPLDAGDRAVPVIITFGSAAGGGSGVGAFRIDRATGELSFADPRPLGRHRHGACTLRVVVDDRRLTSAAETVTIDLHHWNSNR